ncbi:unnamed protein product [Protopolystoma xenopodis]|uniref:Rab-GAP TBC domain-containing protein n=1 Tax=Protopolystoma xenopodis TaxID=117903 RepID=A0A3S5BVD4_9PLAT|nr:unnamed protein product [Protopolystoma xenopodis]
MPNLLLDLQIVATLLLILEEEDTFWQMCCLLEDLLPASYYSSASLLGVQADQRVLLHLLPLHLPRLHALFQEHNVGQF